MSDELFRALGLDASSPEVVEARQDARNGSNLVWSLVQARKCSRLSQADVAARMGTTQSAVSDIERTAGDHHLSTLQRYARAVGGALRTVVIFEPIAQDRWRDEGTITVQAIRTPSPSPSFPPWKRSEVHAQRVLDTA